jgi:Transposase DDE domain
MAARQVARDVREDARDIARRLMGTKRFLKSRDERKRVEMRFAHLKTHHGFERMRLRGLSGARDEFTFRHCAESQTLSQHRPNCARAFFDSIGHERRFDPAPTMSGLPLTADVEARVGHCREGSKHKVAALQPAAREQEPRGR